MFPAAPVRFSITTGCPHLRDSQSATSRGTASAVPPAGNGTMILTVRTGHGSDCAAPAKAFAARQRPNNIRNLYLPRLHISNMSAPLPAALDPRPFVMATMPSWEDTTWYELSVQESSWQARGDRPSQ